MKSNFLAKDLQKSEVPRLEAEVLKKLHERIVKSFMDMLILAELKKGLPMSGYDVIALIHKKFHILMSSGTVYSVIYSLERNGLIEGVWNRRKRVYKLTNKGEETIKTILNAHETIQKNSSKHLEAKSRNVKRDRF